MNKLTMKILITLAITVIGLNTANAAMIGVSWSGSQSQVFRINPATGETQLIGDTGVTQLNALTEDGQGGLLAGALDRIHTIDPVTGVATGFVNIDFPTTGNDSSIRIRSLATAADGTIYAMTKGMGGEGIQELWTIDLTTQVATLIAAPVGYSPQALTVTPDGRLLSYSWGNGVVGSNDAGLISIDPVTGAFTDINPAVSSQDLNLQSLTFDPFGNLYGVSTSAFYAIDLITGEATFIAEAPLSLRGLAYVVPIPPALLLFASGLLGLCFTRKPRFKLH